MIWLVIGAIFVLVVGVLVFPLWRNTEQPLPPRVDGGRSEASRDLQNEKKRLLANLRMARRDFAEGKLTEADFRSLEAEYEQQLLPILDASDQLAGAESPIIVPRHKLHRVGSLILAALLAASVFPLYLHARKPAPPAQLLQAGSAATLERLEHEIAANPGNVAALLMQARSYANLGRQEEAGELWRRVLELEPGNHEARGSLAVQMLQSGGEAELNAALQQLAALSADAPEEPAWLWYQSRALIQLGRQGEARTALNRILALLPPESDDRQMVQDALRQLDLKAGP